MEKKLILASIIRRLKDIGKYPFCESDIGYNLLEWEMSCSLPQFLQKLRELHVRFGFNIFTQFDAFNKISSFLNYGESIFIPYINSDPHIQEFLEWVKEEKLTFYSGTSFHTLWEMYQLGNSSMCYLVYYLNGFKYGTFSNSEYNKHKYTYTCKEFIDAYIAWKGDVVNFFQNNSF